MGVEVKIGLGEVVDKIITRVDMFKHRFPVSNVDADITAVINSYMLGDSIQALNVELKKHGLEIIEYFAVDPANNTFHVVEKD